MDSNGFMATGWQQLEWNGALSWYYFESSGALCSNCSKEINGKTYHFDSSGVCTNP